MMFFMYIVLIKVEPFHALGGLSFILTIFILSISILFLALVVFNLMAITVDEDLSKVDFPSILTILSPYDICLMQ